MTLEEAQSRSKPSVDHFRVFGCISHVHIPNSKRTNLDDKSVRCVLLRVSEKSKAYRLYDPISQKIIISRDVKFEEENNRIETRVMKKPLQLIQTREKVTKKQSQLIPIEELLKLITMTPQWKIWRVMIQISQMKKIHLILMNEESKGHHLG